jgi:hypothetical protein
MTSQVKFNAWQNTSGTPMGTIINARLVTIPYSTATPSGVGYTALSNLTTSNTASFYSFTYTPVSSSSYIVWNAFLDVDRAWNSNQEVLAIFVNGSPASSSFRYPRVQGHEPNQHAQSGTYTNSSTSNVTFDVRYMNGAGGTGYLGQANGGGDQTMANNIVIYEVQR